MYRVKFEPGVWFHRLEELRDMTPDQLAVEAACASSSKRIVYYEFAGHADAYRYFQSIYMRGDQTTMTTQELLALPKM